jgi:hypothetical protein
VVTQDERADASNAITEKLPRIEREAASARLTGAASLVIV